MIRVLPFLKNPKDLYPSYKMDLDFLDCFGRKRTLFYNQKIMLTSGIKLHHICLGSLIRMYTICNCGSGFRIYIYICWNSFLQFSDGCTVWRKFKTIYVSFRIADEYHARPADKTMLLWYWHWPRYRGDRWTVLDCHRQKNSNFIRATSGKTASQFDL